MKNLAPIPLKPSSDYKKFSTQQYPGNIGKYFFSLPKIPIITKQTKLVSVGSCFASEISTYLKRHGYTYITAERKAEFSANWGIVFNPASIRQIFQYSFNKFHPMIQWWEREKGIYQDPFRRNILYPKETAEQQRQHHYKCSNIAISSADVIIVTLGLSEIWRDKRDKTAFWRVPPMHLYSPDIYEFYNLTVDDVYQDLCIMKSLLNKFNPSCKLIMTVSPVPLQNTYRTDVDVISANVYSKSTLRCAVDKFVKEFSDSCFYFPSFEFVRYGFDNPYLPDKRHPTKPVIRTMMQFFEYLFVKE